MQVLEQAVFLRASVKQKQPPEVFYKKAVLKNFAIMTGKHLGGSLFLKKLQACIAKFLRKPIFKNICERQLLIEPTKKNPPGTFSKR